MNIFVLDHNPKIAAQSQCDKHVVKMIVESAQMLSTAHRMLDGVETKRPSVSGKTMIKYYELQNPHMEEVLYKAVHTINILAQYGLWNQCTTIVGTMITFVLYLTSILIVTVKPTLPKN